MTRHQVGILGLVLGFFLSCVSAWADPGQNVEIKITIRADQIDEALRSLGLQPSDAKERTIYFFDTRDLRLFGAGVILRARSNDHKDEVTAKLRPFDHTRVDQAWFGIDGFKCEYDRVGGRDIDSCSLNAEPDPRALAAAESGSAAIPPLSDDQRRFLGEYAPSLSWQGLEPMGPIASLEWKRVSVPHGPEASAEMWRLPDGTRLLEVSGRVAGSEADATEARLVSGLEGLGLDTRDAQETKTRRALEYFSAHHARAAQGR